MSDTTLRGETLSKSYDPKTFEERIYKAEKGSGSFAPHPSGKVSSKGTFTVVMPPPNVTGILHMGHALNNSLQDIMVRYRRMQGYTTLWVPGTDHAGIATQHVVEKLLCEEGTNRHALGREEFLRRTWQVKEKHHDIIAKQLEKISSSCDWSRERFTMDEGLSRAVRECFVTLYERGLIYKGEYLVNYCPHCGTALADDEVDHKDVATFLWDVRYPFADGSGSITVATTRPETMFADTAVAVHPSDPRYQGLIGKELILPLTNRRIKVIADSFVDMEFGSGAVKITPAHDPNDYECARRNNLEIINLLGPDGTLNSVAPPEYQGLSVTEARQKTVESLKQAGYLVKETPLTHTVGHCYRCGTAIEPYLSKQWFVKMSSMAQKAKAALTKGEIVFHPAKWGATYSHWMDNIRDWCISRQLWWGHRIPAWTCSDCGELIVSRTDPTECPKCHSHHLDQDPDVLDTWFSSWLWPFSTLGWPDKTPDLATFFPTSALVTAYDIIFFWVSRMVMASLEFMGQVPFKDIYITSLVRDKQGRKMSKSLGNGIDPIEIVDTYGSDAMRFTLAYLATQGQDIQIDKESFKLGSKFANKVWNATRFLLMKAQGRHIYSGIELEKRVHLGGHAKSSDASGSDSAWERWIYSSLEATVEKINLAMADYKINEACQAVYEFFWNDFCDVFLEAAKFELSRPEAGDEEKDILASILLDVLKKSLVVAHPFLPMITEEIWAHLGEEGLLISEQYPLEDHSLCDEDATVVIDAFRLAVRTIRSTKNNLGLSESDKLDAAIAATSPKVASFLSSNANLLCHFAGLGHLTLGESKPDQTKGKWLTTGALGLTIFLRLEDSYDFDSQIAKTKKELAKATELLSLSNRKLSNPSFTSNASPQAVEKERSKAAEFTGTISRCEAILALLGQ